MENFAEWMKMEGYFENLSHQVQEALVEVQESQAAAIAALEEYAVMAAKSADPELALSLGKLVQATNRKLTAESKWVYGFAKEACDSFHRRISKLEKA